MNSDQFHKKHYKLLLDNNGQLKWINVHKNDDDEDDDDDDYDDYIKGKKKRRPKRRTKRRHIK